MLIFWINNETNWCCSIYVVEVKVQYFLLTYVKPTAINNCNSIWDTNRHTHTQARGPESESVLQTPFWLEGAERRRRWVLKQHFHQVRVHFHGFCCVVNRLREGRTAGSQGFPGIRRLLRVECSMAQHRRTAGVEQTEVFPRWLLNDARQQAYICVINTTTNRPNRISTAWICLD